MNSVQRTASVLNPNDSHFDGVMWCGVSESFVFVWCYKSPEEAGGSSLSAV
jgi:hypothetical protein